MNRWFLIPLFLAGLVPLALETRNPGLPEIESAYQKGLSYIAKSQDPKSVYADRYLAYVYPKEDVPGPAQHHYPLTYRVIDGLTATTYLADLRSDLGPLNEVLEKAWHDLQGLPPIWRGVEISNFEPKGPNPPPQVALDTYCIIGLRFMDLEMARKVKLKLKDGRWLPPKFFGRDAWREIADESWCIIFLLETGTSATELRHALESRFQSLDDLRDNPYPGAQGEVNWAGAMIHLAMIGETLRRLEQMPSAMASRFHWVDTELVRTLHWPWVRLNPGLFANVLISCLKSDQEEVRSDAIAQLRFLLSLQTAEGSFLPPGRIENSPVFVTLRVVTALAAAAPWLEGQPTEQILKRKFH